MYLRGTHSNIFKQVHCSVYLFLKTPESTYLSNYVYLETSKKIEEKGLICKKKSSKQLIPLFFCGAIFPKSRDDSTNNSK